VLTPCKSGGGRPVRAIRDPVVVVTRERRLDQGRRRARSALEAIGDELRAGRLAAALTQREVGDAVGISHAQVSRIERGLSKRVPYETLVLMGAVLGLDIPLRAFPAGEPVRDAAQLALLASLRRLLATPLRWRTEVPLRIPGDRRAWDAVIEGRGWRVPVEAETRLRDVQALSRRIGLKQRDDRSDVVILLVADTRHNRHVLRLAAPDLAATFPVAGRAALAALSEGRQPSGSSIVLQRVTDG
jgi:transcriptional regulator with XRE-family HTH domain